MAEFATDAELNALERCALMTNYPSEMVSVEAGMLHAAISRLRKAEADLARLHAAIDEAEKHGPEVVHFIRAMATQGGGNG